MFILEALNLANNQITPTGILELTSSKVEVFFLNDHSVSVSLGVHLKMLDLSSNNLKDKGVYYLSQVSWPALKSLNLKDNKIQDEGVKYITEGRWPYLEHLDISSSEDTPASQNRIGMLSLKALVETNLKNLKSLNLRNSLSIPLNGVEDFLKRRFSPRTILV